MSPRAVLWGPEDHQSPQGVALDCEGNIDCQNGQQCPPEDISQRDASINKPTFAIIDAIEGSTEQSSSFKSKTSSEDSFLKPQGSSTRQAGECGQQLYPLNLGDMDVSSDINGNEVVSVSQLKSKSRTQSSRSSRQRRKDDMDRFRTHTITREDIMPMSTGSVSYPELDLSSGSPVTSRCSPRSVKQRREEEADRFKTQIISAADLVPTCPSKSDPLQLESVNIRFLEEEAKRVVEAIDQRKCNIRSRSCSADNILEKSANNQLLEILEVNDINLNMEISGSDPSISINIAVKESSRRGPRICKPDESQIIREETGGITCGIRGRRKALYSKSQSTVQPSTTLNPSLAPKANSSTTGVLVPKQIRPTRAPNAVKNPPTSITPSVRSQGPVSSVRSPRSVSSTRPTQAVRNRAPMARQRTFTKDEREEFENSISKPAKLNPKPSIRKESVPTATTATSKPPTGSTLRATRQQSTEQGSGLNSTESRSRITKIAQTRTSQLRERSCSRQSRLPQSRESIIPTLNSVRVSNKTNSSSLTAVPEIGRSSLPPSKRGPAPPAAVQEQKQNISTGSGEKLKYKIEDSRIGAPKKVNNNNKVVASKISNLWKQTEDCKNQTKEGNHTKENKNVPLKPPMAQDKIKNFQRSKTSAAVVRGVSNDTSAAPITNGGQMKARSRSRLSMKLSKFSNKKEKEVGTDPDLTKNVDAKARPDSKNGNVLRTSHVEGQQMATVNTAEEAKRLSRLGSFFKPDLPYPDPNAIKFRNPSQLPASAIVPPFNYSPPLATLGDLNTTDSHPSTFSPSPSWSTSSESNGSKSICSQGLATPSSTSQKVKRNNSYLSSMGRRPREAMPQTRSSKGSRDEELAPSTLLVTLV